MLHQASYVCFCRFVNLLVLQAIAFPSMQAKHVNHLPLEILGKFRRPLETPGVTLLFGSSVNIRCILVSNNRQTEKLRKLKV